MEVVLVSCAKEFALGENDVLELIERMFVKSPQSIDSVGSASSITYVLKPSRNTKLVVPDTDSQKVEVSADRTVTVTVTPAVAPSAMPFPYKGTDENLLDATKPTRFLQSADKKVVELARRAVGDAKDSAEAVRRIEAFVARYMTNKGLSVGYASASEVADSRAGDCTEFAVLTAAMCRAVGIPAQVVVGVAYVKDFAGIEGFGGHAWTQAYVGDDKGKGTWVGLDAAFKSAGLGGYDAGHLALAIGDGEPGAFFNMAAMLGNFTIEKLTVNSTM
jgi:transglutaminase-like putative cysteine protease